MCVIHASFGRQLPRTCLRSLSSPTTYRLFETLVRVLGAYLVVGNMAFSVSEGPLSFSIRGLQGIDVVRSSHYQASALSVLGGAPIVFHNPSNSISHVQCYATSLVICTIYVITMCILRSYCQKHLAFCVDNSVHLSGGKYSSMDGSCILITSYSSSSGSSSLPRLPLLCSGTAVALILHPHSPPSFSTLVRDLEGWPAGR
jgi:hypothetical protein